MALKTFGVRHMTITDVLESVARNIYMGMKGQLKDQPKMYNRKNFTTVFNYFNGPHEMEVKSMQPEDLRNTDPHWPDLLFLSRDTFPNKEVYFQAFQDLQIRDNEVNRKAFYKEIDKIMLKRLPMASEGCVPPFFKHIFMHRQVGLNRVHIDIEPDVIESRLPGIGETCECYNIWILCKQLGWGWNPCAVLYPAMIPNWEEEMEMRRAVLQLRAPLEQGKQDPWIWWGEMKVGDIIMWKSRKGFHSGCINDTFEQTDRRFSLDFRRIYGPRGYGKRHAELFARLHNDSSFQHP